LPPGSASTYSRPVLGASGTLTTAAETSQGGSGIKVRILRKISFARPRLEFVQDHTKTGPRPG